MTENVPPRRKRVVLCMGEFCNLGRRADKLYKQIVPLIAEANAQGANLKLETARCLNMCDFGPNLIIYPDNLIFNDMNEAKLTAIAHEHLTPNDDQ
jgi:(2Fe-2S) ferredoxin